MTNYVTRQALIMNLFIVLFILKPNAEVTGQKSLNGIGKSDVLLKMV